MAVRSNTFAIARVQRAAGSASERGTWLVSAAASIVFALSVPATAVFPRLGHFLLISHLIAIGLPAIRLGRRGAWIGALMSTSAFAFADLGYGMMSGMLRGVPADLALVAGMGAVLALLLGEMGRLLCSYRAMAERAVTSERRYDELFDGLSTGLLVLSADGIIRLANRRAAELLGSSADAVTGTPLSNFVSMHDWQRIGGAAAGAHSEVPVRVTLIPSGRRTEWSCPVSPTPSDLWTLAFWDAEEAIQRDEELSRRAAALESLQEGVIFADLDGRISFANRAAALVYGCPDSAAICGTLLSSYIAARMQDTFAKRMERACQTGWSGEMTFGRRDGSQVPVRVTISPVRVDGALVGTVAIATDLTEQRAIAERAAAADKLATLGRLVAGAAHEINNPLAAILSNAELLQLEGVGPEGEASRSLGVIVEESRRAGRIVRDLLSFARQRPASRACVSLSEVVRDVLALRSGYLAASGIEVVVQTSIPDAVVLADRDQLKQVLLNLIVNAEDAVRHATVRRLTVTVSQVERVALLLVDDSGPGIPGSVRERIFEPFFTTKPQGQGTGLGLSVSYGIVGEHGGQIWVEDGPSQGARFVVQLPIAAGSQPVDSAPAPAPAAPSAAARRRVLIVDDEEPIRTAARRILVRYGHRVEAAADGHQALALARSQAFDAIVCDLRMPNKPGQELYEDLRREGLLAGTVFIVATGDTADLAASAFLQETHLPVLLKPFDIESLLDAIHGAKPAAVLARPVGRMAGGPQHSPEV